MSEHFKKALQHGAYDYSQGIQDALHGGKKPEKFRSEDHMYKKGFESAEKHLDEHRRAREAETMHHLGAGKEHGEK